MINVFKRIITLIENYQEKNFYNFEKHNCIERANLQKTALNSCVPFSQIEPIISLMKGFDIIGEYETHTTYRGYPFNKEKYNLFKGEQNAKDNY